jgi:hypothetical protein
MRDFSYIYRWDRHDRKDQPCRILARGKMNSCLVEFPDGYRMVTSRNAIGKAVGLVPGSSLCQASRVPTYDS